MNGSVLNLFSDRGTLTAKDVTPWQTFSGKGMKFQLQSFDWAGCACVSHLTMRAFLGLMKIIDLFATAREVDSIAKTARNREYVEGLISNGGPAINTIRQMLGSEAAETLFRRFLFGTER